MKARGCLQSKSVSAPCGVCGIKPEPVHMPRGEYSFRCSRHCETCTPMQTKRRTNVAKDQR
jgi:hypothetical protein